MPEKETASPFDRDLTYSLAVPLMEHFVHQEEFEFEATLDKMRQLPAVNGMSDEEILQKASLFTWYNTKRERDAEGKPLGMWVFVRLSQGKGWKRGWFTDFNEKMNMMVTFRMSNGGYRTMEIDPTKMQVQEAQIERPLYINMEELRRVTEDLERLKKDVAEMIQERSQPQSEPVLTSHETRQKKEVKHKGRQIDPQEKRLERMASRLTRLDRRVEGLGRAFETIRSTLEVKKLFFI